MEQRHSLSATPSAPLPQHLPQLGLHAVVDVRADHAVGYLLDGVARVTHGHARAGHAQDLVGA